MKRKNKVRARVLGLGQARACLLLGASAVERYRKGGGGYNEGDPILYFFPVDPETVERIRSEAEGGGFHSAINIDIHVLRGQRFNMASDPLAASMTEAYRQLGRKAPARHRFTWLCEPNRLAMQKIGQTEAGVEWRIWGHHTGSIDLIDDPVAEVLLDLGARVVGPRSTVVEVVTVRSE